MHQPPPLRISHRLKEFFRGLAMYWCPALFFRLIRSVTGSNGLRLMSHSSSPPAEPRVGKWMAYLHDGSLVGRGGLSRMPRGARSTRQIQDLVDPCWSAGRLEIGWALTHLAVP